MLKSRRLIFIIASGLLTLIFSCAPTPVVIQKPPHLPSRHVINKVPQIHQGKNECGPTSLAMVLNYYGIKEKKDELKDDLKWNLEKGIPYQNMLQFPFKKFGLKIALVKRGSIEKLMEYIAQDQPVIVRQWLNYEDKAEGGMTHLRVAMGYDHEKEMIYMRDPAIKSKGFSNLNYKEFLDLWDISNHSNPSKNLMLIIIPEE